MENKKELKVVLTLDDKATKGLDKATHAVSDMSSTFFEAGIVVEGLGCVFDGVMSIAKKTIDVLIDLGGRALNFTIDIARSGITFARVGETLKVVQKQMGITDEQLEDMNKQLADANLFGIEASEALLTFAQSGLSGLVDIEKWVLMSKDFAAAIGVSSLQGVKDFTKALGTLRPELLDKYRITFNLNEVYGKYADTLNKNTEALTGQEKRIALVNYLYELHSQTVEGVYKETYDTASKSISSIGDAYDALKAYIGKVFEPAIKEFSVTFRDILQGILKDIIANQDAWDEWGERFGTISSNVLGLWEEFMKGFTEYWKNHADPVLGDLIAGLENLWDRADELVTSEHVKKWFEQFGTKAAEAAINFLDRAANEWIPDLIEYFGSDQFHEDLNEVREIIEGIAAALKSAADAAAILFSMLGWVTKQYGKFAEKAEKWAEERGKVLEKVKESGEIPWGDLQLDFTPNFIKEFGRIEYPGKQHGGTIPATGPYLLHRGERVVPKTGADVHRSMAYTPTVNFYGNLSVRSQADIDEIANKVSRVLGRQSEIERWYG